MKKIVYIAGVVATLMLITKLSMDFHDRYKEKTASKNDSKNEN